LYGLSDYTSEYTYAAGAIQHKPSIIKNVSALRFNNNKDNNNNNKIEQCEVALDPGFAIPYHILCPRIGAD